MNPKIRVHGKSQSRTALGIINAYLKLHPDATPSEVQEAFPKSLNRRATASNIIVPIEDTVGNEKMFFERDCEQIIFKNGERYALVEVWTKDDFLSICEHAKQYGIDAAKECTKPFEKGSFEIEDLVSQKITLGGVDEDKDTDLNLGVPLAVAGLGATLAAVQDKNSDKDADTNAETPPTDANTEPPSTDTKVETPPADTVGETISVDQDNKKKCKCKWWWWLLLLLLLLLLIFFVCKKCCNKETCGKADKNNIENVADADADTDIISDADTDADKASEDLEAAKDNLITDKGNSISVTLPNGNELNIDKNSQEYKLFQFLNSPNKVDTDKTQGWLNMDKVQFQSGKSVLASGSDNQLKSISQIMQFFPNSHLKIGGYTDNTGSDETNMRISGERAKVTADRLVSLGVPANRITFEGYGSKHPVCPANDTDDCRARNRRIDVRVTQK